MPEIVSITPALAETYKQVRLRALEDSPSSFSSTYAREAALTDEDWQQRSISLDGFRKIGFIAMDAGKPCGLCLSFLEDHDPKRAEIISMWVAPSHRRTGLSSALIDAARAWAESRKAVTLGLMVTSNNAVAATFYRRYGFEMTGRSEPYPNDPAVLNLEMILALH